MSNILKQDILVTKGVDTKMTKQIKKKDTLKNRTRFSSTLPIPLLENFKKLSEETRIAQSVLLEEAIHDLLAKYHVGQNQHLPPK